MTAGVIGLRFIRAFFSVTHIALELTLGISMQS